MADSQSSSKFFSRHLDAASRVQEIMCGLIMVLSFTLLQGIPVGEPGVNEILLGALGCNMAWGVIDGALYVMGSVTARHQQLSFLNRVNNAPDQGAALAVIGGQIDDVLDPSVTAEVRARIGREVLPVLSLVRLPQPGVVREDFYGMISIFVVNLVVVIPAIIPFLVISEQRIALRVSNALLVGSLFAAGFIWGKRGGFNPYWTGSGTMLIALALVGVALVLGG